LSYLDELTKSMTLLSQDDRTLFIGQSVIYGGTAMFDTLTNVPFEKRIEVGVMEDTQMGMSIGLSLRGYIPISIYPRFDFLICAMNQLVNHLDKISEMSSGEFNPRVIIRTAIGSKEPLYPGIQHCSDYTHALKYLLRNVRVIKLEKSENIVSDYLWALNNGGSYLLIEEADSYAS